MTPLPNLADLPPSEAHAAWMQWLKDNYPMKASLIPAASEIGMAVGRYERNNCLMNLPDGYEVAQGGASAEGDYPGGEGWFFSPADKVPTVFYKTKAEAVAAAWRDKCAS